jgi:cytoskeletal protein RodZ
MSEKAQKLSFGRYLRSVRREKGISLEQISKETRIGLDMLNLIEQEDLSGLPAEVFVKGFIRSYAKAVGADGGRAVSGYLISLSRLQKTEQSEADLDRLSNRFWPHMMMAAGILIVVITVSIFALSGFQKHESPTLPAETRAPAEAAPSVENEKAPPPLPAAPAQKPAAEPLPVPASGPAAPTVLPAESNRPERKPVYRTGPAGPEADKQILEITAVAETWMQIVIDNEKTKEVTLEPGDRLALEASKGFELLIGNAGGVSMKLNGEPVAVGGRSGQVRNLTLP